jgi:RNA polymerase sigma factor (sigma-70 family)
MVATLEPGNELAASAQQATGVGDAGETKLPASLSIAALTQGMVVGNEDAYRSFYEAYYPRLTRYLLVVTNGDADAAREALQAAFVRVVRHIKVFDDEARFWNWLTVLARTAFVDQRRKRSRYLAFLDRFTEHARTEAAVAENGQADARLLAALEFSVRSLPAEERALVDRKYLGRESVRDIADSLQSSEKAVESRLGRARRKLKELLLERLKHEAAD